MTEPTCLAHPYLNALWKFMTHVCWIVCFYMAFWTVVIKIHLARNYFLNGQLLCASYLEVNKV